MSDFLQPIIPIRDLAFWYRKGWVAPLIKKIPFNCDPWEIFLKIKPSARASADSFFLDSVKAQPATGRFSFAGFSPFLILRKKKKSIWLGQNGKTKKVKGGFLNVLRRLFHNYRSRAWKNLPDFLGGAIACLSYDLAWEFEKLPSKAICDFKIDDAIFLFMDRLFAFDLDKKELYLIANLIPSRKIPFDAALLQAQEWIGEMEKKISKPFKLPNKQLKVRNFKANVQKRAFKQMVLRAKEYISAGDIYQANLSQRFSFDFSGRPEMLYQHLRRINPSPFSSFVNIGNLTVISASPERLVKKTGRHCETRPIAGTRPRGRTAEENQKLRNDLIINPKERAEHLMLVDLERNDLGRVCRPHTVRVSEMMIREEYSHVIHLVSNIEGELARDKDQFDVLQAMFPGGTITGCPKIRCMEIIESLEPFKRGLYTGSIGYFGFNGDMDLNIVIRTIILNGRRGYFQVGAGIVHDSDPEAEYWETLHKGKALMDALAQGAS